MKHSIHRASLALALVFAPSLAFADPMCRGPFASVGCFVFNAVAWALLAAPVALVAMAVYLLASRRRSAPAAGLVGLLSQAPVAFLLVGAACTLAEALGWLHPAFHGGLARTLGLVVAGQAAWIALALRPWRRRPR